MKNLFSKMMVAGLALALSSFCLMGCESVNDTVKIGNQIWMAKNLNVNVEGSMCYDNDPANCEKYGRLYTWEAAKTVCPAGWHLPSQEEFGTLLKEVGSSYGKSGENLRVSSWDYGLDKYGFSALPAGFYLSSFKEFSLLGSLAIFWSSTEGSELSAYYLGIDVRRAYVDFSSRSRGYSVRCLKDAD